MNTEINTKMTTTKTTTKNIRIQLINDMGHLNFIIKNNEIQKYLTREVRIYDIFNKDIDNYLVTKNNISTQHFRLKPGVNVERNLETSSPYGLLNITIDYSRLIV